MKLVTLLTLALISAGSARGESFTSNPDVAVPDFDFNGVVDTIQVSGLGATPIGDVNVALQLAGGWNGDYYAYLWHEGQSAVLLNRAGRTRSNPDGYSNGGFGPNALGGSFTLDDQAAADVHRYQTGAYDLYAGKVTGTWQPDGRSLDPEAPGADFDLNLRPAMLDVFNGLNANGAWSLYLVDASPGAVGRLVSWEITVAQVPEPGSAVLAAVAFGGAGAVVVWKRRPRCAAKLQA